VDATVHDLSRWWVDAGDAPAVRVPPGAPSQGAGTVPPAPEGGAVDVRQIVEMGKDASTSVRSSGSRTNARV
jgi:hypothetical protein